MTETRTILVIDDSLNDREFYRRCLKKIEETEYHCIEADDGKAGLALMAQHQPDCILLDYTLPGRDGLEVLREIQEWFPMTPVIMLTGQGNERIAVQSIKDGAYNYMNKALISHGLLHHTIREAISHGAMKRDLAEKDLQIREKTAALEKSVGELQSVRQEQERLIVKLMESNTELERFAYVASHDMQEPLRMVTNFSEIIATDYKDMLDEHGQEYLQIVRESGQRMRDMVNDLLEYARLGTERAEKARVDGETELTHVLQNLDSVIHDTGALITHDPMPSFEGNPIQFMQLLQNLICNALKYRKPGVTPKVHIGAAEEGKDWHLSVTDNGIGIDDKFLQSVFQPFRRLHNWNDIKGTGLGLSVCKRIVNAHGGAIWAESVPGMGSAFHFTIPRIAQANPLPLAQSEAA